MQPARSRKERARRWRMPKPRDTAARDTAVELAARLVGTCLQYVHAGMRPEDTVLAINHANALMMGMLFDDGDVDNVLDAMEEIFGEGLRFQPEEGSDAATKDE
jgi:hypothetical protein